MKNDIKVYIAGPLTSGNVNQNLEHAMTVCDTFLNKGFVPYCPHLNYFMHLKYWRSYQAWLDYDMEWLKVCDVLFRIEGFSPGADKEVEYAKSLGIPVYTSLYDLEEAYK